jgi:hypothetical protein
MIGVEKFYVFSLVASGSHFSRQNKRAQLQGTPHTLIRPNGHIGRNIYQGGDQEK